MLHKYPSLNKQTTEYRVLDFDQKGTLIDINSFLNEAVYQQTENQAQFGKDWIERQHIIKFIEKYRTAYLTRDIKKVELMFAEDALILVGRKIEKRELTNWAKARYNSTKIIA
jgi:hypothetical protein